MIPTTAAAAANNAQWCGAVLAGHGIAARTTDALWIAERMPPPLYPGIVTLVPGALAAVTSVLSAQDGIGAVKDSFADLDLHGSGFRILLLGEWLVADPVDQPGISWSIVAHAQGLATWERGWRAGESLPDGFRMFPGSLLRDRNIRFVMIEGTGGTRAGGVLNLASGVVGLSNLFGTALPGPDLARALARVSRAVWPGTPVVLWDSGASLIAARGAGLRSLGPLRVWVRN